MQGVSGTFGLQTRRVVNVSNLGIYLPSSLFRHRLARLSGVLEDNFVL